MPAKVHQRLDLRGEPERFRAALYYRDDPACEQLRVWITAESTRVRLWWIGIRFGPVTAWVVGWTEDALWVVVGVDAGLANERARTRDFRLRVVRGRARSRRCGG